MLLEAVEAYVRDELVIAEQKLEEKLRRLEKIVMGHFKSPFTVYDPAHGEIQMELYSIIPLQSLDRLPVINFVENIEKIKRLKTYVSNNIPDLSMPNLSGEWVPPFTGKLMFLCTFQITQVQNKNQQMMKFQFISNKVTCSAISDHNFFRVFSIRYCLNDLLDLLSWREYTSMENDYITKHECVSVHRCCLCDHGT